MEKIKIKTEKYSSINWRDDFIFDENEFKCFTAKPVVINILYDIDRYLPDRTFKRFMHNALTGRYDSCKDVSETVQVLFNELSIDNPNIINGFIRKYAYLSGK